jgi:3-polyprenyl-4-hydroxybenzoate decarboxylase
MKGCIRQRRLLAHLLIIMLTVTTAVFGVPPVPASAVAPQNVSDLFDQSKNSIPGELTITWYDAKRYEHGRVGFGG